MDFHHGVVHDGDVTYVQFVGIQETVKGLGIIKCFDLGFVQTLAELAPHGIQHHFGQPAQPFILLDLVVLQLHALVLIILAKVLLTFGFVVPHPRRPPAGFLLDFQPGVDVVSEEPLTGLVKMPHFVNVLDLVPQRHRFLQFGTTPHAGQDALLVGVVALGRPFQKAFGHVFFQTRRTEGKSEFTLMAVRQHGMVQGTRREHSALDEAKVEVDVGVTRLRDEVRMPFGVHARLVDPRVQGGVVNVMDLLTWGEMMVQFDGIGTTSTEGVTRVERVDEFKVIHERLDVQRGFFEASPVTSPHFHDIVPQRLKQMDSLLGFLVHILHGPITVAQMFFVTVGITAGAPVDETALEFVHRVRVLAVPIHEPHGGDVILAGIADMLNVLAMTGMGLVKQRLLQDLLLLLVIAQG